MAFYLYDKNGFVDQIATYQGMQDILNLHIARLNDFLTSGGLETKAEKESLLYAMKHVPPELEYLRALLEEAQPPLIVSDGLDSRVDKFHPESEVTTIPPEDSIQSVEDAKRVYEKYTGEPM
jgi:hypothetical protein